MIDHRSMSGKRIDVLVVFNEDARIWYHYIVDHIGKDKFELNIQPINDGELVELIKLVDQSVTSSVISDVIGRSCVQRLANASAAKTFIVVASPGLIRVLHENSDFNYQRLIGDPLRTQILLWGVDDADLYHPSSYLASRFPRFDLWTKVSASQPDHLLTNAVIMIETWTQATKSDSSCRRAATSVSPLKHSVTPRLPRSQTMKLERRQNPDDLHLNDDDRVPLLPAPPPPSTPAPDFHQAICQGNFATLSATIRARRRIDCHIQPSSARCEEPTTVFVFFNDAQTSDTRVEIFISDLNQKLRTEFVNPYSFMFIAPVHAEGTVFLQVILNDVTMATHPLVYYSLTANIVTGLSQIYLEQLSSLITAVITDDTSSTDDVNLILPDTLPQPERVGLVVASEPVWNASHIDALMTKFFVEESIEKIPAQAFEELFGVYSRVNTAASTQYDYPTLVHLAAAFDLRELAAHLVDLPDARLACAVRNSRGQRSEEVARQCGHLQLASFLENFRLVDESFENCGNDASSADRSFTDESVRVADEDCYMSLSTMTNDDKIKCSLSVPISAPNVSVDEELTTEDEEEHYLIMDRRSPAAQQCSTTEETKSKKTHGVSEGTEVMSNPLFSATIVDSDSDSDDDYIKSDYMVMNCKSLKRTTFEAPPVTISDLTLSSECLPVRGEAPPVTISDLTLSKDTKRSTSLQEPMDGRRSDEHYKIETQHSQPADISAHTVMTFDRPAEGCENNEWKPTINETIWYAGVDENIDDAADEAAEIPLHIELVNGTPGGCSGEVVMSQSQLELVDILKQVKDHSLTIDDAEEMFVGWKQRNQKGLTRSFKEKKEHLEKMRLDIEKSAAGKSSAKASVTEKSGGTKVKQKRSFSKKFSLSFSRKSATSDVISSPLLTAPVQASQLLLPKMNRSQSTKPSKLLISCSIPEEGHQVNSSVASGKAASVLSSLSPPLLRTSERSSGSSFSSTQSTDSVCHSDAGLMNDVSNEHVSDLCEHDDVTAKSLSNNTHDATTENQVDNGHINVPVYDKFSSQTSVALKRRSRNLEMLVNDLRDHTCRPPPLPPRSNLRPNTSSTQQAVPHSQPICTVDQFRQPWIDLTSNRASLSSSPSAATTSSSRHDQVEQNGDVIGAPVVPIQRVFSQSTDLGLLESKHSVTLDFLPEPQRMKDSTNLVIVPDSDSLVSPRTRPCRVRPLPPPPLPSRLK